MKVLVKVAGLALTALLISTAPTFADGGDGGYGGDPGQQQDPAPGTGSTSDSGDPTYTQVKNCSVVSSSSYLGLACAGGDGWTHHTIKETLAGDELPDCWHEPMTSAETQALMLAEDPDSTWYWYRCLKGIDPVTLKIGPDGVWFTIGWVSLHPGDPVLTLTPHQQQLVAIYRNDGQIPYPIAGVSPMEHPRVGAWVSFFDGTDDTVTANAGGVMLKALVERTIVRPLGESNDAEVGCDGIGYKAQRGETRDSHPAGCWWQYVRSSAAQPDQKYAVKITAHWRVLYSTDGGSQWTEFNQFDKSQITTIPVTEIEALVVR